MADGRQRVARGLGPRQLHRWIAPEGERPGRAHIGAAQLGAVSEPFLLEQGVSQQEVLSLSQGAAQGLLVVQGGIEESERERSARPGVGARRGADDGDRPALNERHRLRFV